MASEDLTELSLEALMEVRIVGASKYEQKPEEVGAAVSVITRSEIRAFGWRTLAEALSSLPGVHITYDRSYTYLGTRGFGLPGDLTARVLITINGNRVNDPVYDGGPAGRELPIDMALVERIEFIPGPGGAVYGQNAMFGVVNVITRNGVDVDGLEADAAYLGMQHGREGRVSWGTRLESGTDLLLSLTRMRADGTDPFLDYGATGIRGVAKGLDGESDKELFAHVTHGAWSLELVHGDRRKEDPTASYFSDPLAAGQHFEDSYTLAQAQYAERYRDDTLHATARLFAGRYRYRDRYSYGTPFSARSQGDWNGAELRLLATGFDGHKLLFGVEAQDNVHADQSLLDFAEPANSLDLRHSGYRIGVYAQDEWRIQDSLFATLGLRIDRNDATGTSSSPRAALIWRATETTTIKALYGRAHRAPNVYESEYDDTLSLIRNGDLAGERIDTLELIVDQRIDDDFVLRASAYAWTMRDIITLGTDDETGLTQYQAGDTLTARGLEASADKTWTHGTRLRGSIAWQHLEGGSGATPPNSPRLLAKMNVSSPLPWLGLRLGYEMRYDGSRLTQDGTRLGSNVLANINVSTDGLADGLLLWVGVNNLFDQRYKHPAADSNWQTTFEQDGRSLRAGLRYEF